jgi:nanoRNase/pAp phosphatase (c-di-AMP/oligoRNAs hydrolase)
METNNKYRLVTRSDFDGLACAVLLKDLNIIDDILFVHPKDMQDGLIDITERDITTNLPYVEASHLVFDHHSSELIRLQSQSHPNYIINPDAPSAARVVYEYYGGEQTFPHISRDMMIAVDKADSAQYDMDDVLHPKDWALLNFIMDARTGLGRFRVFRISNYSLMMSLIDSCTKMSIDQILDLPDVKERTNLYFEHEEDFKEQLGRCSTVNGDAVSIDLRHEELIHPGNRFMIYSLYPECNISIHVIWGVHRRNTVLTVGKSIFNRSSKVNIGEWMLEYGGGGHANAGTCQIPNDQADQVLADLIKRINAMAAK